MTVGKRVQFDDETWAVVNLLQQERRRSFQQLADEAFADLLAKQRASGRREEPAEGQPWQGAAEEAASAKEGDEQREMKAVANEFLRLATIRAARA